MSTRAEEWADSVRLCLRRLEPDEQPPHSVTDFPRQYRAIVEVIRAAILEEREACLRDGPEHVRECKRRHYQKELRIPETAFEALLEEIIASIRARPQP
jgi:hypothetical protein